MLAGTMKIPQRPPSRFFSTSCWTRIPVPAEPCLSPHSAAPLARATTITPTWVMTALCSLRPLCPPPCPCSWPAEQRGEAMSHLSPVLFRGRLCHPEQTSGSLQSSPSPYHNPLGPRHPTPTSAPAPCPEASIWPGHLPAPNTPPHRVSCQLSGLF